MWVAAVAREMLKHGTANTYRHGCRCDECREYNTWRQRNWRAHGAKWNQPPEPLMKDLIGTAWMKDGACRGHNTDWWFNGKPSDTTYRLALKICANCPVRTTCLQWALQWPVQDLHGIWGGTSQRERVRITTEQRKAPTCPTTITLRTTGRISGERWTDSHKHSPD